MLLMSSPAPRQVGQLGIRGHQVRTAPESNGYPERIHWDSNGFPL